MLTGSDRNGARRAGDAPAQGSPREATHREMDGEVARNAADITGAEGAGAEEERVGRGAGLGYAPSSGDR